MRLMPYTDALRADDPIARAIDSVRKGGQVEAHADVLFDLTGTERARGDLLILERKAYGRALELWGLIRDLLSYKGAVGRPGWLPTPENVNALPEPVRRYIHDLETRCGPAGDV